VCHLGRGKGGEGRGGRKTTLIPSDIILRSEGMRVVLNRSFLFALARFVFLTPTLFTPPVPYSLFAGRNARSRRRPEKLRMATRNEEIAAHFVGDSLCLYNVGTHCDEKKFYCRNAHRPSFSLRMSVWGRE
jgi:hypothetical protein